ncbi:MAG TPA: glycosyltransferase family 2 protein [Roseiflexaceae bacterium]|nr:glycosyltransferase family 2 protein [Roseiflexaceae bacterium]
MTTLAVIIVSWNVRELLRRCIASVHASLAGSGIVYRVVVVDNASADGTPAMLRAAHPEVLLLEAGRNLGFAGGNNLALRRVMQNAKLDYVLLLNPDTEVVGEAIPRLVRYLDAHPDVAVVGPRLRYPDGAVQPTRRRFPTPGTFFWESTPLEWRWPGNPWARRYRMAGRRDDVEQEVDWLVGAALLVRRAAVERAGLLDAGFALYSEELEWQRRIRIAGSRLKMENPTWNIPDSAERSMQTNDHAARGTRHAAHRIVYLPEAEIVHHEGKSSEQLAAGRLILFHRSRLRYVRMTHGRHLAGLVRRFLLLAYGAEVLVEAAKWLAGHRRPLRAGRIAAYRALLRALATA